MCSLAERRTTLPAVLFAAGTMAMSGASAARRGHYGYDKPATSQQIAGWDIDVRPDGTGLPPGSGTLTQDHPQKTVGCYWRYATTLWDYVNRTRPFTAPHTLSANDVYALTAYILNLNDVVDNNFIADRNSLPKVTAQRRQLHLARSAPRHLRERMHEGLCGCETDRDQDDGGRKGRNTADHGAA